MRALFLKIRERWLTLSAWLLGSVALLLPWWRNHALLRDFYDYGNVMSAVGRMHSGEHAYVDFLTPIQTLIFLVGAAAEKIWGARYLSLTYANAVFIVVAFGVYALLLAKPLGRWLGLLVAAAVVAASATQHTIVWYNSLGVAWLAIGIWLMARLPERPAARGAAFAAVLVVLWLSGMTKVTYHVGVLAFVLLFTGRAMSQGRIARSTGLRLICAWFVAALVLPIATEMLVTGATFAQWRHNVLLLARSRTELLQPIATLNFYLRTPHDYYEPMYLPFIGAWGLVLLGVCGAAAVVVVWRQRDTGRERALCLVALAGALACGLVFLATHFEIAYLSGAAWLVLAAAVVLAFVPRAPGRPSRMARGALALGAVSLLVPAWSSAWAGARPLYGRSKLNRADFVTANTLPARFAYLRGLEIPALYRASLFAFASYEDTLAAARIPKRSLYFVNGTDWMVRVVPEAVHPGLPLWLQFGTTFGETELPLVSKTMCDGAQVQAMVAIKDWDDWPQMLQATVKDCFAESHVGPLLRIYQFQPWALPIRSPIDFASNTDSNLFSKQMSVLGGRLELVSGPNGSFAGSNRSQRMLFQFGLYGLSGVLLAEREPGDAADGPIFFRIRAPGTENTLLWDQRLTFAQGSRSLRQPFAVSPGGRPVTLELELPAGSRIKAGWRSLKTDHAGDLDPTVPGPLDPALLPSSIDPVMERALFASDSARRAEVHAFGDGWRAGAPAGLAGATPGELWFRIGRPAGHIAGEYVWLGAAGKKNVSLKVAMVCCKSGRFDVTMKATLKSGDEKAGQAHVFEGWFPEGEGWIGLSASSDDGPVGDIVWRNIRVW